MVASEKWDSSMEDEEKALHDLAYTVRDIDLLMENLRERCVYNIILEEDET
jgi:hypothetical protein